MLSDAVICGHDREYVAALAWINQAEARRVLETDDDVAHDDPRLRAHLGDALAGLNRGVGSASRVERLLLLSHPPSLDAGEITDKGYINQRACLRHRAHAVSLLYVEELIEEVILPSRPGDGVATGQLYQG